MATATKTKMKELLEEAQGITKKKTQTTVAEQTTTKVDEKFADVENNTFYKIIFSEAEPEEKKKLIAEALSYKLDEGKEKNAERLKEFTLFKEYLQHERKLMAQEIIKMTDTGAFSELKAVIDDLNKGLLEFDERMNPLTQIIDAVFELRKAGGETVLGVFQEIKDDQQAEEERKRKIAEDEAKLQQIDQTVSATKIDIEMLKKRRFLGLLGPSDEAQRQRMEKEMALEKIIGKVDPATGAVIAEGELHVLTKELQELRDPAKMRDTKYAEFIEQKARLRELLDISSEEHKERQKALVNAAQNFVVTTDERVNSVLTHLDGMSGQIDNLSEANNGMRKIYAVLEEASHDSAVKNQELRKELDVQPEGEGSIAQMTRESKLQSVEEYVTELGNATLETTKTFGDLQTQGVRIKSMKDANREQVNKTRELHSSGVAGVADRLSTVLQAVSGAALNESSEAAKMSVNTMNDKTNAVAMQEAIRTAMGLKDTAAGINRAIDDLKDYKEGLGITKKIVSENRQAILEGMQEVQKQAREVAAELKATISAEADVDLSAGASATPAAKPANQDEPAASAPKRKTEGQGPMDKFGKV